MITTHSNEKKVVAQRTNPLFTLGLIAALVIVLVGIVIYGVIEINNIQANQRTQAALHSRPLTNVETVKITGSQFMPANIQVKVGTTVTWTNEDSVAHTIAFRNGMQGSGLIEQGKSYRYTFSKPGTFAYFCSVHPAMVAQVVVTP